MALLCWWFVLMIVVQNIVRIECEIRFCGGTTECICTQAGTCVLKCQGKDKCKGSDFKLGCYPGYPCIVECNALGEENACEEAIIDASLATDLTIECRDTQSCLKAKVYCGTGTCNVICTNTGFGGSQCELLTLNCGINICHLTCQDGVDTCSDIIVNIQSETKEFQCLRPILSGGIYNDQCDIIDQYIAPFTKTTSSPTLSTLYPTIYPTHSPSINPTISPTVSTNNPTKSPSINPTISPTYNPTVYPTLLTETPSFNPTQSTTNNPTISPVMSTYSPSLFPSLSPTNKPTIYPTKNPTIYPTQKPITPNPSPSPLQIQTIPTKRITSSPTNKPTKRRIIIPTTSYPTILIESTKKPTINYYVIGDVTGTPTNNNVYAEDGNAIHSGNVISLITDNWMYTAIGGGTIFCCLVVICIRCYNQHNNKPAKPAKHFKGKSKRKGKGKREKKKKKSKKYGKKSKQHKQIPSSSKLSARGSDAQSIDFNDDCDNFIPAPPPGPPPLHPPPTRPHRSRHKIKIIQPQRIEITEGALSDAEDALPDTLSGTLFAGFIRHNGPINDDIDGIINDDDDDSHDIHDIDIIHDDQDIIDDIDDIDDIDNINVLNDIITIDNEGDDNNND